MNPIRMYPIKVDQEVYSFLKSNAEPFEDTPNSVLRRFLLTGSKETQKIDATAQRPPSYPSSVPDGLAQILQVIYLVKVAGMSRIEATRGIAEARNVTVQTVIDKYTRQLGMKAYEFDGLLDSDLEMLKGVLKKAFPHMDKIIEEAFKQFGE